MSQQFSGESTAGYLHPQYAQALTEFGTPRKLHNCRGSILVREIAGSPYCDGMGPYPLFSCKDWSRLPLDLHELNGDLVSLALVADPFGDYDRALLETCFPDRVIPFKVHYVIDLECRPEKFVSKHHRRYAGKALNDVAVEITAEPSAYLDDWVVLYDTLIERHNIMGIAAFSRPSFARQFEVPGAMAFRAVEDDRTVGMTVWYVQGSTAYYHLGAHSERGYELRASFALFWRTIEYFRQQGMRWLNLGGGAGLSKDETDGLSRFKAGWSTGTRMAYFCGRIFDHKAYQELVKERGITTGDYFPLYRKGEFQ